MAEVSFLFGLFVAHPVLAISSLVLVSLLVIGRSQIGELYQGVREKLMQRFAGDSSTDAPPPEGKQKKRGKGQ